MQQKPKPVLASKKEASLHLFSRPVLDCTIKGLCIKGLCINLQTGFEKPLPNKGDLTELHFGSSKEGNGLFKIRAMIDDINGHTVQLGFVDPEDASVKQLAHWFVQDSSPAAKVISADGKHKIHELSDIFLKQFPHLMDAYLELADIKFFKLAESTKLNDEQNKLFEIKSQFRQHADKIKQLTCCYLQNTAIDYELGLSSNDFEVGSVSVDKMALIDQQKFEENLSIEKIIQQTNSHYHISLISLEKRYSVLLGYEVGIESLPFSVKNVCYALQDSIKNFNIASDVLPLIYQLFDEAVVSQIIDIYDQINAKLKSYGILPDIESRTLYQSKPAEKTLVPISDDRSSGEENIMPLHGNAELFSLAKNIFGLLNNGSNGNETAVTPATGQELADMLSVLQADTEAMDAIANGASLQDWLGTHSDFVLSDESLGLVNLVETIFQKISGYQQFPLAIIEQLKRLEVPVVKMALKDKQSFFSSEHPANQLLNQLIDISLNTEMPNKALENKFHTVISDVTENFENDDAVFQRGLSNLSQIQIQQQNACARNAERIAQTYNGRQCIKQAEDAVDREIQRRISPPHAPDIAIDLLENGWRGLLILTYIKLGKNSDVWKENLGTFDQLLRWLTDISNDDVQFQSRMERELEADSFVELIDCQLNDIFPGDYRYQQTIENIRDTLKDQRDITLVTVNAEKARTLQSSNELQRELEAANPHLSRWFKRAKSLEVGQEFSQINDETGLKNIKLVWLSKNKQHFVFINNRGQKVFDYDLVDMATALSKGLSPVEDKSEWPVVEQGLHSAVQSVYEQLSFKNTHDELTGLVSRKECENLLSDRLLDAKNQQQYNLLYIDVDKFALVNELHGHVVGDQLLVEISNLLESHAPKESMIARMAGNEFVMLLKDENTQHSRQIADKMRNIIEGHKFELHDEGLQLTVSMGLIVINKYTSNVIDLLRNAVNACQAAKKNGGNRVHEFKQDSALHDRRHRLLSWIDNLEALFSSDKLVLRGQKISPLSADSVELHYEILLAIKNDEGELTSPVEFIEAAECYNRMQRVDRWVIEHTFSWLNQQINDKNSIPSVSINLSGNSINDESFMDFILEQFAHYKVPTSKICFEVTETATINNLVEAADFIRGIKKIGCKCSLDDFGSGNASYQYLKHLPVDYLKIDGMFVKDMNKNKNDYALVKSIHEIAHIMDKTTIAEFVESEDIISSLRDIGVDYIQGFAVGLPTPLHELVCS